ncbi:MAG: division/cell wall cluster transcriptional repressor MraZ [Oligoflexia bacterium]|nr:division/cell wall cluster transcriptional repressor MraZ [Oligoflexia bacterium]
MDASSPTFRGRFEIKLDPKARLSLPVAYRECLKSSKDHRVVITNGQHAQRRCLDVYTFSEWKRLENQIQSLNSMAVDVQSFQRFYLSGGQVIEADGQFRVLVPQGLKHYAGLQTQIVLVGLGNKFEIWAQETWNTLFEGLANQFESTLASVSEKLKESR